MVLKREMSVPSTLLPCHTVSARPARRLAPKPAMLGLPMPRNLGGPVPPVLGSRIVRWGDAVASIPLSPGPNGRTPGGAWSGRALVCTASVGPRTRPAVGRGCGCTAGGCNRGWRTAGVRLGGHDMESVRVARKMGYKGHDMRPFIGPSSQGNFPKSTPSKRGMTQPLTHSHVLEPMATTLNESLNPNKGPP